MEFTAGVVHKLSTGWVLNISIAYERTYSCLAKGIIVSTIHGSILHKDDVGDELTELNIKLISDYRYENENMIIMDLSHYTGFSLCKHFTC